MNSVILVGKFARDPVIRATQNGKTVASFTVVTERHFQTKEKAYDMKDFVPCVAWGTQAQEVGNKAKAGADVEIKGRIGSRSYEDNTGAKRYITEVTAEEVNIMGASQQGFAQPPQRGAVQQGFNQQGSAQQGFGFQQFGKSEDIPF